MASFQDLGLPEALLKAVEGLGFTEPMPIQAEAIPRLSAEPAPDCVALAATGTGKTCAYGLPLLARIDGASPRPQALILAPTRELCLQIGEELARFAKFLPEVHVAACYGGAPIGQQIRRLERGAQVVVATPGRLCDLIRRESISLADVRVCVLDEADEMLDMGFRDELTFILEATPEGAAMWLFSATMPPEVETIAQRYLTEPIEITVGERNVAQANIAHHAYAVAERNRYGALRRVIDFVPEMYGLVFCRTRVDTQRLSEALMHDGVYAEALHGDLSQAQRDAVMRKFREKAVRILVATDVAARGLQIDDLELVVNYDLPEDYENYVHRIGRTARAGKEGRAISLASEEYIYSLEAIENYIQMKIPVCWSDEYGLEEVEDKSLEYVKSIRRRAKERNGRKDDGRNRRGERGRKPASSSRTDSGRRPAKQKEKKLSDSDYENLAKMSFEERLAFYKNEFSSKPSSPDGKKTQKPEGKSAPKKNRNTQPGAKAQNAKSGSARVKAPVASITSAPQHISTKPEKKSFWAKVVSIFKGE